MYSLGVETSTQKGSLCLFHNRDIVAHKTWERTASHSEYITSSYQALLLENKISSNSISRLLIGIGPGSFTGIRVGINFVRAFSYTQQTPIYTLNSLELIGYQEKIKALNNLVVAQYAFRNLIYVQTFNKTSKTLISQAPASAMTVDAFIDQLSAPIFLVGTASEMIISALPRQKSSFLNIIPDVSPWPDAHYFQYSPGLDPHPHNLNDWIHTIPLYIRASEAEEKLNRNT